MCLYTTVVKTSFDPSSSLCSSSYGNLEHLEILLRWMFGCFMRVKLVKLPWRMPRKELEGTRTRVTFATATASTDSEWAHTSTHNTTYPPCASKAHTHVTSFHFLTTTQDPRPQPHTKEYSRTKTSWSLWDQKLKWNSTRCALFLTVAFAVLRTEVTTTNKATPNQVS